MVEVAQRLSPPQTPGLTRRDATGIAFFGTWMVTGLYLDGWAHIHDKPETFFTPWHAVLYSGFGAAVAFFTLDGWLRRGRADLRPTDRVVAAGLAIFIVGAVGDFVWHEIFGIEVDLEALLSPTHLALLGGGVAMLSGPWRSAWTDDEQRAPSWSAFAPAFVSIALSTAVASFFLMYLSAFGFPELSSERGWFGEVQQIHGVASVLTTSILLLAPTMLILRRWRPPAGAFTLLYGAVALGMVGMNGLRWPLLIVPGIVGGLAADVIVRRSKQGSVLGAARLVGGLVPLVMWSSWFAAVHATGGVRWPPELVAGSVVLAVFAGIALSVLVFPFRSAESATQVPSVLARG